MSTRFHVDLLHPGWVERTWQDWFTGSLGWRRLAVLAIVGLGVLLVVVSAGVLPAHWRLSGDLAAIPGLRNDLAARNADLGLLRGNLQALSQEARRQVRWADVLTTLSQQIAPTLRLQLVEMARVPVPPPPGQPAGAPARLEEVLRLEALTPLRAGGPPLLDVAAFMAGLMSDPVVGKRFQLKSWEVKPSPVVASGAEQFLSVTILLAERPQ